MVRGSQDVWTFRDCDLVWGQGGFLKVWCRVAKLSVNLVWLRDVCCWRWCSSNTWSTLRQALPKALVYVLLCVLSALISAVMYTV